MQADTVTIRELSAAEAEERLGELAAILVDAVAHGASVNFLKGLTLDAAAEFWRGQLPGIADGSRHLLVADEGGALIGTVVLSKAPQPNQPHRADVGKMLVLDSAQRRGLGRRLLTAIEELAVAQGRTLLQLDTTCGSAGERLYERCGWTRFGVVPGHARAPSGKLTNTSFFYKQL
ncbi:MAG: GNAT family N-acetyltransferase [Pseudolabrys sp.]|nr:GNAT family N-acetyltransferase [Pseudolabrys sp.]